MPEELLTYAAMQHTSRSLRWVVDPQAASFRPKRCILGPSQISQVRERRLSPEARAAPYSIDLSREEL
jgi:hypothetical protein